MGFLGNGSIGKITESDLPSTVKEKLIKVDEIGDLSQLQTKNKSNLTAATNEITTQLAEKANQARGEVLLTDYFDKGNDTDYTQSFIRAFNVLKSVGGGTVIVPNGTFEATIKIPSNCGIKGKGAKTIIKIPNNSNLHGIQLENDLVKFAFVENLSILGNKGNQTKPIDGIHFYVKTGYDYDSVFNTVSSPVNKIKDVMVFGCSGHGIHLEGKGHSMFINVDVYDCGQSGFNIHSYDNYFINCASGQNFENGFNIHSNNNHLSNVKSWNNGIGNTAKTAGYGFYCNNTYWMDFRGEAQGNLLDGIYLTGCQNSIIDIIVDTSGQRDAIYTDGVYGVKLENSVRNKISANVSNRLDRNENKLLYALGINGTVKDNIIGITCTDMISGAIYYSNPSYNQFMNDIRVYGTNSAKKSFEKKDYRDFSLFSDWASIQATLLQGETYVTDYNNFNTSLLPANVTYGTLTLKKGGSGGRFTVELMGLNSNRTQPLFYIGTYDNSNASMKWSQINEVSGKFVTSGDGSATTVNIPHGLGVVPTVINAVAGTNHTATAQIRYITADATNIIVNFANPTPTSSSGNNIIIYWNAKP